MRISAEPSLLLGLLLQVPATTPRSRVREVDQPRSPQANETVAIVGATLIDGRGGAPILDAAVVVQGVRILAVGRRSAVAIPPGAVRVDGAGMSVLPGLIDAHFHLDGDQGLPALYLRHGVTSVRDPGAWIEAYDAVRASKNDVPRLFLAGPHLDQPPPAYPDDAYLVRDTEETRAAVNRFIDQGASVIKVYFRLPPGLIAMATKTAHARGIPVTAHLETVDAAVAIEAGIDGIEHITSLGPGLLPPREAERYRQSVVANNDARQDGRYHVFSRLDLATGRARRLVALVVRRGVVLSPTLAVFERRAGDQGADSAHVRGFQQMLGLIGMARRAGAKIVVGSHSSVPHAERGWAYQREMELLVEAGLTPMAAITAATLENARFFRVADRLGSLQSGKVADLVLVEGRPDRDITAMRRIKRVMLNGRWVY